MEETKENKKCDDHKFKYVSHKCEMTMKYICDECDKIIQIKVEMPNMELSSSIIKDITKSVNENKHTQ
jgi:hypothetical protein